MIEVKFRDSDDRLISQAKMYVAPVKGDYIWLLPNREDSSWVVTDVAHWVGDTVEDGYHNLCVYVEPTK